MHFRFRWKSGPPPLQWLRLDPKDAERLSPRQCFRLIRATVVCTAAFVAWENHHAHQTRGFGRHEAARVHSLLGSAAAAWPVAARAQHSMRRIGVLMSAAAADMEGQAYIAAFRRAGFESTL